MHTQNLIIGFGKAGKTLAADLAKHGQQVVLVEQSAQMYGGTCINIGCIPSKKLIVESEQRGHNADKAAVFAAAMNAKNTLIPKLRAANFAKLDNLDGVTVLNARAEFLDDRTVKLTDPDGGEQTLTAERIFINTGATPRRLGVAGEDSPRVLDSTGVLALNERPRRLVIIGGGYIGLEFAFMFHAFGSEITILDGGDRFLPREDRDIAEEMLRVLNSKGIKVLQGVKIEAFRDNTADTSVITSQGEFTTDAVLVATGRTPNVEGLNLEAAGVELTERGAVKVDDLLRTTADGIWALGDVNGGPQHTYISLDDYRVVWSQLNGSARPYTLSDRRNVPSSTFLHTPYSRVGLNEREAKAAGLDYVVKRLPVATVPKAQVMRRPEGMMKALVENGTDRILGAMLLAAESHEVINIVKLAMDMGAPASTLRDMMFTHPTMAEALNDLFA